VGNTDAGRYSLVAMVLHWAIALLIVANLATGWWMTAAIDTAATQASAVAAFQWHKSIGLTVLLLSVLRLAWRLTHAPPALLVTQRAWERRAAIATHWLFYGLMIAVPSFGWLYVSTQWRGDTPLNVPTLWFGFFQVPHLFSLPLVSQEERQFYADVFLLSHQTLVWSTAALLVVHVLAALKHQFVDRDPIFGRMLPLRTVNTVEEPTVGARKKYRSLAFLFIVSIVALLAVVFVPQTEDSSFEGEQDSQEAAVTSSGWLVDPRKSFVGFSGAHAGTPFEGRFVQWHANLGINVNDINTSTITAEIAVGSATDGVPLHDNTLPSSEWFDVEQFPSAYYETHIIEPLGEGRFNLFGTLTIKGRAIEVGPLQLSIDEGQVLTIEGALSVDRAQIDMGMESDPTGTWVSREIGILVKVIAQGIE